MTVREIMQRRLIRLPATASLAEAATLLLEAGVSRLYVVDADGRLLGLLPDYELLKHDLLGTLEATAASTVMSPVRQFLRPTATIREAAIQLRTHVPAALPVISEAEELLGEVTRHDVLRSRRGGSPADPPAVHDAAPLPAAHARFLNTLTRSTPTAR